ncbi:MAG: LrgB family protein [Tannerella sp.]|jgi:predicted murein hydrolase (TIGR00659 family)|nr:LrgB family protein [Tannerella sp.]
MGILENKIVLIALTFIVFFLAKKLQKKTGLTILNPILVTIVVLIIFIQITGIDFEAYRQGGEYIEFWLKPAIVALGMPLYLLLKSIKKQMTAIILSQLAGCITGIVSVVLIAWLFGATQEVIISLASKSVTTPIAIEITETVGGIPSLTAAVVVCTGLFGAVAGFKILQILRIKTPSAQGLSIGTASHAVGTSSAMERSQEHGAYASLGLIINGLFTSLLTPSILRLLGFI